MLCVEKVAATQRRRQPASPGQSDVVTVIFAPLPALPRVHSKVQGQQLMLRICKWDHSWGRKEHVIQVGPRGEKKATEQTDFSNKELGPSPQGWHDGCSDFLVLTWELLRH